MNPFQDIGDALCDQERIPPLADESSDDEGPLPPSSDDEAIPNGEITRPKSFRPPDSDFADNPPFVAAPTKKGRPVNGGSINGYIFTTDKGVTGYFRNGAEDCKSRLLQPQTCVKSWTQTLADVLWPSATTSEHQSGHNNEQDRDTPLQPSWMANAIRSRGRNRQRKSGGTRGKSCLHQNPRT